MNKRIANKVYDILVNQGGASESERDSFIYHHCESKESCAEWRFCGKLGFGGKYRSERNAVDCYKEDETAEGLQLIKEMNISLSKINLTFAQAQEQNLTFAEIIRHWKPDATDEQANKIYQICHDKAYKQAAQGRMAFVPHWLIFDLIKYDYFKELNMKEL